MAQKRDLKAEVDEELRGPAEVAAPDIDDLGPGAGYQATFYDATARLTVEGLRQGRDGLKGDVRIEVGPFGDGGFRTLLEGRMELNSMSQRETWGRILRKEWEGCNWDKVLHRFCAAIVLKEKRLDRPAIKLRDAVRPAATGWLLEPLLIAGLPTLWYGDGGSGKSYLGLAAALSLQLGIPFIGFRSPARKLRVLFCDFEFDEWEHRERMRQLCGLSAEAASDEMPDLDYLDCRGSTLVSQADRILSVVRALGSEFLIVDSISYAADGPLNDDETARVYYRVLGSIGLPSLSTGHQPKNGERSTPFGSVHWRNLARLVWHFQPCESENPGELLLKLTNEKGNTAQRLQSMGLCIRFETDGIRITTAEPKQMVSQADLLWRRIASLLAQENRPMGYAELALRLSAESNALRSNISRHPETFVILKADEGRQARVGLRDRAHE